MIDNSNMFHLDLILYYGEIFSNSNWTINTSDIDAVFIIVSEMDRL